jgi:anti-anti-sigma factor
MIHSMPSVLPIWQTSRYVVVTLPDEIDISNAEDVSQQLRYLLEECAVGVPLIVDLSDTRFCDAMAVSGLLRVQSRATALGRPMYAVVRPRGLVRRVFDITAASVLIRTCDDLGSAIAMAVVSALDEVDGGQAR